MPTCGKHRQSKRRDLQNFYQAIAGDGGDRRLGTDTTEVSDGDPTTVCTGQKCNKDSDQGRGRSAGGAYRGGNNDDNPLDSPDVLMNERRKGWGTAGRMEY